MWARPGKCGEDMDFWVVFTLSPAVYSSHSSQRDPVVFLYKVMSLFWAKPSKGFLSRLELNFNPLSIPYSIVYSLQMLLLWPPLFTFHLPLSAFQPLTSLLLLKHAAPWDLGTCCSLWLLKSLPKYQISTWLDPSHYSGLCSNLSLQRDLLWWNKQHSHPVIFYLLYFYLQHYLFTDIIP